MEHIHAFGLSEGGKWCVDCLPATVVLDTWSLKSSADARFSVSIVNDFTLLEQECECRGRCLRRRICLMNGLLLNKDVHDKLQTCIHVRYAFADLRIEHRPVVTSSYLVERVFQHMCRQLHRITWTIRAVWKQCLANIASTKPAPQRPQKNSQSALSTMVGTRKNQARLAFTPLPSSSPATKGYPKQIQERAAAVSLDATPGSSKRRKLRSDDPDSSLNGAQLHGVNDSMPTPAASLEHGFRDGGNEGSQSDEEPIRSTQRQASTQTKPRRKSRQQQLDFLSARDPDTFSSPIKVSSSARPQSSARSGVFRTERSRPVINVSSSDEEELPSVGNLMAKCKNTRAKSAGTVNSSRLRVTRTTQQPIVVDSESEDDNINVSSAQPNQIEQESEDDVEDMPTTTGTQRRKRARRGSQNSFISSSPPIAVDSEDDLEIIEKPTKRRRQEDSDEEGLVTPSKRKLKRRRQMSRQEKDELAEDVEDLGASSEVETSARVPRSTETAQKTAKQKALEKLKRRRSGQLAEPESVEDDEDEGGEGPDDFDELYDDSDNRHQPLSSAQMFNADEYDEDFLEEDQDDGELGVPTGLPLEFTRYASMKPKELFKHAVEWMVQKKINPGFKMDDGLYDLTFRKLDDEVKGLAGSKFTSAAWTPVFTIALKSRPDIAYEPIDRSSAEHAMRDKCDACNRSSHPATYQIQFQGAPYNRQTLEELPGNDDDDSNSDADGDDQPAWDESGQEIAPANKVFYVGRFCQSNAQTAHALQHWRFHLNEWVISWLMRQGYNTPEKIVQRDTWSTEKRKKHANKITDRMEDEGVVKMLWEDFRNNINEARESKQRRYRFGSP